MYLLRQPTTPPVKAPEWVVGFKHSTSQLPNCSIILGSVNGVFTSQLELSCDGNVWSDVVVNTNEGNIQTPPPEATLQTPLRSDCAFCLNTIREPSAQEPNHCICKLC